MEDDDLVSTTLRIDAQHKERADAIGALVRRDRSFVIRALIDSAWGDLTTRGGKFRDDVRERLNALGLR